MGMVCTVAWAAYKDFRAAGKPGPDFELSVKNIKNGIRTGFLINCGDSQSVPCRNGEVCFSAQVQDAALKKNILKRGRVVFSVTTLFILNLYMY